MTPDPRIADLPLSVRPVAEHLGYAAAARLIEVFPGYRLRVPHSVRAGHMLEALGDLAHDLSRHFGGEVINVPTGLLTTEARERRIRDLAQRVPRLSVSEIAGETGLTYRQVQRVLNRTPATPKALRRRSEEPSRQLDLVAWIDEQAARQDG